MVEVSTAPRPPRSSHRFLPRAQPHVVDAIIDGEVKLVLNTTAGKKAIEDSFSLRRAALNRSVPYYTTVAGIRAAAFAMKAVAKGGLEVASLQSYFKNAS